MPDVLLWHFPISHFNEKVRWALDLKRVPHRRRALGVDYLPRALWATGRGTLPILFVDGRAIGDSTRIIAALEAMAPEPALYPADEAVRRRALALEDWLDEEVGPAVRAALIGPLFATDPAAAIDLLTLGMGPGAGRAARAILPAFRAFYLFRHRIDPARIDAYAATVRAAFDRIADEVGPAGYLAGERFSVADLTAAALLSPFVQPAELQYRLEKPPPETVATFRRSLLQHPAARWVVETYRRHRGASAEIS